MSQTWCDFQNHAFEQCDLAYVVLEYVRSAPWLQVSRTRRTNNPLFEEFWTLTLMTSVSRYSTHSVQHTYLQRHVMSSTPQLPKKLLLGRPSKIRAAEEESEGTFIQLTVGAIVSAAWKSDEPDHTSQHHVRPWHGFRPEKNRGEIRI